MQLIFEALDDNEDSIYIKRRLNTNHRTASDIVVNSNPAEEAEALLDRLDTTTTRYKREIGPDKA